MARKRGYDPEGGLFTAVKYGWIRVLTYLAARKEELGICLFLWKLGAASTIRRIVGAAEYIRTKNCCGCTPMWAAC